LLPKEKDNNWVSTASLETLKARAELFKALRHFFSDKNVLEVETPMLSEAATVDPFIDSMSAQVLGETMYLQTSPEFYLKRLLAAGSGDVYSLAKAFRQGERGGRHHPEFTMLEWYRVAWDEHRLMDEVAELVQIFLPGLDIEKFSYGDCFLKYLAIDPHSVTGDELTRILRDNIELSNMQGEVDKDTALDLLMTHCVEPQLPKGLVFVYDYPASKAALAKLGSNVQGQSIARRFEAYLNGMELANGYFELTDADEQQARFEKDVAYRLEHNLPHFPYDKNLVSALKYGLPECAGVALGLDRLLMILCNKKTIQEVISFAEPRFNS
jgi:lysyl-tRNA synthetase class 2